MKQTIQRSPKRKQSKDQSVFYPKDYDILYNYPELQCADVYYKKRQNVLIPTEADVVRAIGTEKYSELNSKEACDDEFDGVIPQGAYPVLIADGESNISLRLTTKDVRSVSRHDIHVQTKSDVIRRMNRHMGNPKCAKRDLRESYIVYDDDLRKLVSVRGYEYYNRKNTGFFMLHRCRD